VTRAYEDALLQGLRGAAGSARASGPQYYEGPEFETGRFYGLAAAAAAGAPGAAIDGDTVRVVAMGEEPVITKRLVVKEVLVIKRRRVVEDRVIEVDLRSERVDVDRRGAGVAAARPGRPGGRSVGTSSSDGPVALTGGAGTAPAEDRFTVARRPSERLATAAMRSTRRTAGAGTPCGRCWRSGGSRGTMESHRRGCSSRQATSPRGGTAERAG
jgi:hypothetical protein